MTSDPSIERRVSRLENDTESIYELIDDFRAETRSRFDGINATLTASSQRSDRVEGTLTEVEATLNEVVRRLPEPS